MKRRAFLLPVLCAAMGFGPSCNAVEQKVPVDTSAAEPEPANNFAGSWLWAEGDDRFTLTLTQKETTLTGYHASSQHAEKDIDYAGAGQPPSITGEATGDSIIVRFRSAAPGSAGYGHARLLLRGRYLYWQKVDETGENYLPANAILIRQETAK